MLFHRIVSLILAASSLAAASSAPTSDSFNPSFQGTLSREGVLRSLDSARTLESLSDAIEHYVALKDEDEDFKDAFSKKVGETVNGFDRAVNPSSVTIHDLLKAPKIVRELRNGIDYIEIGSNQTDAHCNAVIQLIDATNTFDLIAALKTYIGIKRKEIVFKQGFLKKLIIKVQEFGCSSL